MLSSPLKVYNNQENLPIPQLNKSLKLNDLSPLKSRKNKRSPGGPLTPSVQQNIIRRKLSQPLLSKVNYQRRNQRLVVAAGDGAELLEYKFKNWVLQEDLKRSRDVVDFLQREREMETLQNLREEAEESKTARSHILKD